MKKLWRRINSSNASLFLCKNFNCRETSALLEKLTYAGKSIKIKML